METDLPQDNIAFAYRIEGLDAQGRVVRLGHELNTILSRHEYPEVVARLLGEALVLTTMLGSALKFEGRFVLQTQSDGPVPMLICDVQSSGDMRAYAKIDHEKLSLYGKNPSQSVLLGKGHIAFTVDQGADMENYQGVVPLEGDLTQAAHYYFEQSEQIETRLRLAAGLVDLSDGHKVWRAGGILLQKTASEGGQRFDDNTDAPAQSSENLCSPMIGCASPACLKPLKRLSYLTPNWRVKFWPIVCLMKMACVFLRRLLCGFLVVARASALKISSLLFLMKSCMIC